MSAHKFETRNSFVTNGATVRFVTFCRLVMAKYFLLQHFDLAYELFLQSDMSPFGTFPLEIPLVFCGRGV